jgi:hypothetical protein
VTSSNAWFLLTLRASVQNTNVFIYIFCTIMFEKYCDRWVNYNTTDNQKVI